MRGTSLNYSSRRSQTSCFLLRPRLTNFRRNCKMPYMSLNRLKATFITRLWSKTRRKMKARPSWGKSMTSWSIWWMSIGVRWSSTGRSSSRGDQNRQTSAKLSDRCHRISSRPKSNSISNRLKRPSTRSRRLALLSYKYCKKRMLGRSLEATHQSLKKRKSIKSQLRWRRRSCSRTGSKSKRKSDWMIQCQDQKATTMLNSSDKSSSSQQTWREKVKNILADRKRLSVKWWSILSRSIRQIRSVSSQMRLTISQRSERLKHKKYLQMSAGLGPKRSCSPQSTKEQSVHQQSVAKNWCLKGRVPIWTPKRLRDSRHTISAIQWLRTGHREQLWASCRKLLLWYPRSKSLLRSEMRSRSWSKNYCRNRWVYSTNRVVMKSWVPSVSERWGTGKRRRHSKHQ